MLDHFSLDEMLGFYKTKYRSHDTFHLLRSLVYFTDAENQRDPDPLKKITWQQVKSKVVKAVRRHLENNLD